MVAEIAPGILVIDSSTVEGKLGVVVGRRAALAVDAGLNPGEGHAVADAVRATGHRPDHLAYTHPHNDHVLGGSAFRGGEIYARVECAATIAAQIPGWATQYGRQPDELTGIQPTVRFTGNLTVELGEREVQLVSAPGHAPGTVIVVIPDAGVVFGGDTMVTNIPPAFFDGDSGVMEATLRQLADLDMEILVPGHGPIVQGQAAIRANTLWMADYLGAARAHVMDRFRRVTSDEIVASAPYEPFIGDRFDRDRFRMGWRHEMTIRTIIAELERSAG